MEVIRKSQPNSNMVHNDAPLTNISIAYLQSKTDYIADKIFPIVPVAKQSDKYYTYTLNDFFRDEAIKRPPSAESAGSGYAMSTDTYYADVWAFHKDIADMIRANADAPINMDADATEFVTQRLLISRERQFATNYFASSIWGTTSTPTNLWSDFTNSTPIADVITAVRTVKGATGFKPNTMVVGGQVWDILKQHPDIIERYKYGSATPTLTTQQVAAVFDLENFYVGDAIYATNAEGATAAYSQIFGKHALVCYVAPRPALLQPSAGYIFGWTGYGGGNPYGISINKLRMDLTRSDRIEGELSYDMKLVAADLGYYFASVVA
jgi:hypothetical protein